MEVNGVDRDISSAGKLQRILLGSRLASGVNAVAKKDQLLAPVLKLQRFFEGKPHALIGRRSTLPTAPAGFCPYFLGDKG